MCDRFKFPCHLGSHISSLKVDQVCDAVLCVQTIVWLPILEIFSMLTDRCL